MIKALRILWIFQWINILIYISIVKLLKIYFVDIVSCAPPWEIAFIEIINRWTYYSNNTYQWWISFTYTWIIKITLRSVSYYVFSFILIKIWWVLLIIYYRWGLLLFIFQFLIIWGFNLFNMLVFPKIFKFKI